MNENCREGIDLIIEKIDSIIDIATDKELIRDYPTNYLFEMVEKDFEIINNTLLDLEGTDPCSCKSP